jgi:glucosamine--fructose-6-phosphate aminotransferase (isomerizing)
MCGIFGYVGNKSNAATIVLAGLKNLEYRGYDSWGIAAAINNTGTEKNRQEINRIIVKKRTGKIGQATIEDIPKSSFAFGHTRWATHGGVSEVNAHPHLDCTKTIALIHNGIIENYSEIKERLIAKGHIFISETDTEVAVHLIEEHAKVMMFAKAVQKAFNEMSGLNAFIVMNTESHEFVAVRNGSPLVVGFGDNENFLASDADALLSHTKQVHYLEDNEMAIVSADNIKIFNAHTGHRVRPNKQLLTWSATQVEKGKYPFFMLKEIHEQPGIIADIAADSPDRAKETARMIKQHNDSYILGCGTAGHASMAASILLAKIAGHKATWALGSEFGYLTDFLTSKSLIFALSQSGETMDTLEAVRKAKQKNATVISMVNVMGSSLYRESDHTILIGAGPEKGVASTKAFTGKMAHILLIAYAMIDRVEEGQKLLVKTAKACKSVLASNSIHIIKTLAKDISGHNNIYVVGRGMGYPAALETALKIKEISYIHAEGFAAGELKHGVIALIGKGTPCIVLVPNNRAYESNITAAIEMKARGGYIIGISHKPSKVFDYYIPVPDVGIASIIPYVVAAQLLAYYLTLERGFDPDMPRNLAKSVTVK